MFKIFKSAVPPIISSDYVPIKKPNNKELEKSFSRVWQDESLPEKQWSLTQTELPRYKEIPPMSAAVNVIKKIPLKNPRLLEIGCSTGYYNEVFKKAGITVRYEGCDYSESFITKAKTIYPAIKFKICNATKLAYKDKEFDIVFSAGCLLHIVQYRKAVEEAVRVSKKYVIFHRTPMVHLADTVFTKKIGYGLSMLEIVFNEEKLTDLFRSSGLEVLTVNTHSQFNITGLSEPVFMKTYLCQKSTQ